MKLLVSDYDGTFKSDIKNLYLNIEVINKFIESGNKFVIATGRNFDSIKSEIDKYNIPYNYLICNNGLIIFDNQNNIIFSSVIQNNNLKFIQNSLNSKQYPVIIKNYNFYCATAEKLNILEICAIFKNKKSAKDYKQFLESIKSNILCYQINNRLFIGNDLSKASAISIIQERENISTKNIFTVGDNLNDLEMLKEFNGYKMIKSYPSMWFKNIPITREVHTLVKKIQKY